MSLELVERIRSVRFTPVRLRAGYEMDAVDRLLDQLEQAASRGTDLQPLAAGAAFPTVKWREGYDMVEVDRFLEEITSAAPLVTRSTTQPAHGPSFPVESPDGRGVIQEQQGLMSRLFRRK